MQMITRNRLLQDIVKELKKNKIVYIEAPCGWGKTVLLNQLEEVYKGNCAYIYSSEIAKMKFLKDSEKLSKNKKANIYFC